MVGFTTSALHRQGSASMSPMSCSSHKVKRSVSASLAGEVFLMSEGLAECEWISGVLESAVCQDYKPSLHRRKSISLPVEPTVTAMKADSHLQIDPSTVVCHRCEKCFRSSGTRIDGRSLQTDSTRIMRDQKEHANTEGEVRWVPHERMVVDALTKRHGISVMMLRLLRDGACQSWMKIESWR